MRTAVKAQQAMFLENLWREMNKLSSSQQSMISIAKTASKYAAEGYHPSEIVELLVSDGFELYASKECVAQMNSAEGYDNIENSDLNWGFETEDTRGDVANNFDIGCDGVNATDESDAWEKAQSFIDLNCVDQYAVTKVYRL